MKQTAVGPARASGRGAPGAEALSVFFRSLATMVAAGVPLDRSLDHLSAQVGDSRMSAISGDIARQVSNGTTLSRAFAAHAAAFSQLQLRMLAVGERTGGLDVVLSRLAGYEEKRRATTMKVKSALTYPLFLVALSTFMLVVLPPYMFGGLFQMIQASAASPPLLTQAVIAVSNFIRTPWFWLVSAATIAILSQTGPRLWQRAEVRREVSERALRAPVLGRFFRTLATARFARALELQLGVGEGPLTAIPMACAASGNPVLQEAAAEIIEALKGGETLVDSLKVSGFFPRTFLDLARAGEESARLPELLGRAADLYEGDLDQAIDQATGLLEPMIMLVMGVIVGIVVVATMLPMMTLIRTL